MRDSREKDFLEEFRQIIERADSLAEHAASMHEALRKRPAAYNRLLRLRYVCPNKNHCPLIEIFNCPLHEGETLFYKYPYVLSNAHNLEHSNESGRRANTRDGDNHWKAQTSGMESLAPLADGTGSLGAHCRHLNSNIDVRRIFVDLDAVGDTPVTIEFIPES